MQEIVNRILEGNFEKERQSLSFSCTKIELLLPAGTAYESSFRVSTPAGCFTSGFVTSSDIRMECVTGEFTGCDEEIFFCFHGENLEEGDKVHGAFSVISNYGEYKLPFVVSIAFQELESSQGAVKNLFHFTNLAKNNWKEAVKLFYKKEFSRILEGDDARYFDAYRGLSANYGNEQNVEEFLIHIHKKQKLEYIPGEKELVIELPLSGNSCSVYEKQFSIVRNGWGYTRLYVECRGDFFFTEKEVLTEEDFAGSSCSFPVFVDGNLCHGGRNYGSLLLYNSYVTLEIPVEVHAGGGRPAAAADLSMKRILVQIMELYQDFRLKKITAKLWLAETERLVERLVARDEKNVASRLFQAQLLLTKERYNEAKWLLGHARQLMNGEDESGTLQAYYLYLTTLLNGEEKYVRHVAARVKQIYRKDTSNWRAAWLLLYLSEELSSSLAKKWAFLEKQFETGCTSPVLYIEALTLLNSNPALLRRIGPYELQILYYGARKQGLSAETVEQVIYLSGRAREFSPLLLKILTALYEKDSDVRLLQEICGLLIKGGRTEKKYFKWYEAGVEEQLRITNLYEYFMMSLDLSIRQPIPRTVLMYFSYQNNLDYEHSAYLYDYILQNREDCETLYTVYAGRMEQFAAERLQKGQVNRHLASLYREFFTKDMVNMQTASSLARLLFTYQVEVKDDRLQKIYVYQPGNLVPHQYTVSEKTAWIALYGSGYTIVFEDSAGNRFTESAEYFLEELMCPEDYLELIAPYVCDCPELDLYLYEKEGMVQEERESYGARLLRIVRSAEASLDIKRSCYPKILQYYDDGDNLRGLDEYLMQIPIRDLKTKERRIVLKYMVLRGLYAPAYDILQEYGPYFADAGILTRLISPLMEQNRMAEDKVLTAAAEYAFDHGKYDGTILAYLALYWKGELEKLYRIWKAARAYEADCCGLSERLVLQMMYTGVFLEEKTDIFRWYVSQGARQEVEEAFLSQCAYFYLMYEEEPEAYVFQEIKNMYLRNENVQKVCRLAYLKYYGAHRSAADEETERLLKIFAEEMAVEGIHFDFLRSYKDCVLLQQDMLDKTIVEYRVSPGARAVIYYAHDGVEEAYHREYMKEVCGLCFAEFVLFFGERLRYYIAEVRDGTEEKKTEGILQKREDTGNPERDKYRLLNHIAVSSSLQDYDTLDMLLEEYYAREYYNSRLFVLR